MYLNGYTNLANVWLWYIFTLQYNNFVRMFSRHSIHANDLPQCNDFWAHLNSKAILRIGETGYKKFADALIFVTKLLLKNKNKNKKGASSSGRTWLFLQQRHHWHIIKLIKFYAWGLSFFRGLSFFSCSMHDFYYI